MRATIFAMRVFLGACQLILLGGFAALACAGLYWSIPQ